MNRQAHSAALDLSNISRRSFGAKPVANCLHEEANSLAYETLERMESIFRSLQCGPVQDQAIRLPEVLSLVGVSKSTWYAGLNPRLPSHDPLVHKPFKLGTSDRSPSAWWRSEVMAYVHACANAHAVY